jgi:hypothetical protein
MAVTYGVVWQEESLPPATGRLELTPRGVKLQGRADVRPRTREIAYASLTGVRIGRTSKERLAGHPTLILERRTGAPIRVASVAQSSAITEIAERLTSALTSGGGEWRSLAVVVPLKEGAHEAVRALLEAGPPFDPEGTPLDRHQVFLTPSDAVFVFETGVGVQGLESLLQQPELWKIASSWQEHVAGPPRIADDVYSWSRGREPRAA